jgi:ubiquinone/menaquinone biosynthesis C-methylase UbiE
MDHIERTKQEFTRQAAGFSASAAITDRRSTQRIIEATGAGATSLALDVACGPGSSRWKLRSRAKSWHST